MPPEVIYSHISQDSPLDILNRPLTAVERERRYRFLERANKTIEAMVDGGNPIADESIQRLAHFANICHSVGTLIGFPEDVLYTVFVVRLVEEYAENRPIPPFVSFLSKYSFNAGYVAYLDWHELAQYRPAYPKVFDFSKFYESNVCLEEVRELVDDINIFKTAVRYQEYQIRHFASGTQMPFLAACLLFVAKYMETSIVPTIDPKKDEAFHNLTRLQNYFKSSLVPPPQFHVSDIHEWQLHSNLDTLISDLHFFVQAPDTYDASVGMLLQSLTYGHYYQTWLPKENLHNQQFPQTPIALYQEEIQNGTSLGRKQPKFRKHSSLIKNSIYPRNSYMNRRVTSVIDAVSILMTEGKSLIRDRRLSRQRLSEAWFKLEPEAIPLSEIQYVSNRKGLGNILIKALLDPTTDLHAFFFSYPIPEYQFESGSGVVGFIRRLANPTLRHKLTLNEVLESPYASYTIKYIFALTALEERLNSVDPRSRMYLARSILEAFYDVNDFYRYTIYLKPGDLDPLMLRMFRSYGSTMTNTRLAGFLNSNAGFAKWITLLKAYSRGNGSIEDYLDQQDEINPNGYKSVIIQSRNSQGLGISGHYTPFSIARRNWASRLAYKR